MTLSAELLAKLLAAAIRYSSLPAIDVADLPPIEQLSAKPCPKRCVRTSPRAAARWPRCSIPKAIAFT